MPNLIDVRFQSYRRTFRYNAGSVSVKKGDLVIVEKDGSPAPATVDGHPIEVAEADVPKGLPKLVRAATDADLEKIAQNEKREQEAYRNCLECIAYRNLPMKLVKARILFDRSKTIFFFTANGRVDFRELVKDLAHRMRMRIEMMQIGVRDEAKMLCGYGVCGQPLCCSAWINKFSPVSIRMAKDQNLSLNPSKVSGVCGRLMCCLAFEHPVYKECGKGMPRMGKRVMTPNGPGKVVRMDILNRRVFVNLEGGKELEVAPEDISAPQQSGRS